MTGLNLRKIIRISLAFCLYITGLLSLIVRIRLRKKAVVLMYHRVLSGEEISRRKTQSGIMVETGTFQKQIGYIRKHLNPISLQEFVDHLERNIPFPRKTCLITFDDGWRDNFLNAYPVLRENRVPAVIFLPTDFIGSLRSFWQEELADLLAAARRRLREDKEFSARNKKLFAIEGIREIMASDEKRLPQEIAAYLSIQKKKSISEIERLIHSLKQALPAEAMPEKKEAVFLSWDEIKIMAWDGITFGSHGKSHAILPAAGVREAEGEIRESKNVLEKNLGQAIDAFSYPNGDYSEEVLDVVRKNGYQVAFGTNKGSVSIEDNPYKLKRMNIHQDMTGSIPMFLARIAGIC